MRVILITGMSGSGKSIALKVLEDDGYYCIDNLPIRFLQDVIGHLGETGPDRVAVAIDARGGESLADLRSITHGLARYGHDVKVLFLNARTDSLVQRYSETRRRHPLAARASGGDTFDTLLESIERERELLSALDGLGVSVDTSDLHPNVLRQWVRDLVGSDRAAITILFESFAYKTGVPLDADLVFDVRCLSNPYYDPALRPLTGLDPPVAAFLDALPAARQMIDDITRFLEDWLPHYILDNRSYLTVAVGCTGGQHRSVYCVEQLARRFGSAERVLTRHRSLALRTANPVAQTH
jgi:UPF0042 nucleotide-binding protein